MDRDRLARNSEEMIVARGWRTTNSLGVWLRVRGMEIADDEKRRLLSGKRAGDGFSWEIILSKGKHADPVLIVLTKEGREELPLRRHGDPAPPEDLSARMR